MTDTAATILADPTPAPAADTTPAPNPAPAPAADQKPADPAPKAEAASWLDGIGDADLKAYAQNKAFKDPAEAIDSLRNLEKLLGREKLPLPKDEADADGWNRVYDALGRPENPDGYKLGELTSADPEFAKAAQSWFHEAGLGGRQAAKLAEHWNAYVEQTIQAQQAEAATRAKNELAEVQQEWGAQFDAKAEQGRRAARTFGLDGDALKSLEGALGTKRMLTLLSDIGGKLAEDTFVEGGQQRGFQMTADQAQARISTLKNDPAWAAKYVQGDAEARAEMERLHKIAFPGT